MDKRIILKTFLTIAVIVSVSATGTITKGAIIYVDDDATGANDGSSWGNAYNYLQDALADANSAEKPVEIRVAQGIHKPDQGKNQTLGDREATFQLINGVTLKGGFSGLGKPDPNAWDLDVYEVILSGDLNGDDAEVRDPCDLLGEPTRSENSYHVATGAGTDETAVLDGFTVTGGNADGKPLRNTAGGMFNASGSPRLRNCVFKRNCSRSNGGGMFIEFDSPTLNNCVFNGNYSPTHGGGLFIHRSNPLLMNCTFTGNFSKIFGGGIFCWTSSPELTGCIFSGNIALYGAGGGMYCRDSSPTLSNCTFAGNRSRNRGSGIYQESGFAALVNCILWRNISGDASWASLITYSDVPRERVWGEGNISTNPLFADPGYWGDGNDPNIVVEPNDPNAIWVDGDYHLKSEAGRWDPDSQTWIQDDVTSPCIDAGDPNSPVGDEPLPNGGIINMGAYGGTVEASISPNYYSELLESAVKMAGGGRGPGFQIVRFDVTETPWPHFWPITGLDSPQAVPYLINVLEKGPDWTDENLLKARGGIYPHIARCYAALCLGIIGDSRAFESLISVLQYGDYIEDEIEITYERKDQYHISDYAALALGYLGDPNAVDPLIDTLQKDKREWAVCGLTILRDVKAIKPIIEYLSTNNKFNRWFHSCLEHISRASFPIKYSSNTRKYSILDFPELGEFEGNNVYQALWEHWLVEGDEFAREQFEEYYPKWTLLRQERPDDHFSQDRVIFRMVRGGVPALPYVMDQIDMGDESLLPAVEFIRKGGPIAGCSRLAPEENRVEILLWWTENKHKWLIFDIQ